MSKFVWCKALVATALAVAAQTAGAAWVSLQITAPIDGGGPYTDAHFFTTGDGNSEGFTSQVATDFSSALANGYTSNAIVFAKVGMVYGEGQPEAICFYFAPSDLLREGATLEIVLDLPWIDVSDDAQDSSNFNPNNARLSRAGGLQFGIPGPTITHFDIANIQLGQFEHVRLDPGPFDGRVLDLNRVSEPGSLWLSMLGLTTLGWLPFLQRPARQRTCGR